MTISWGHLEHSYRDCLSQQSHTGPDRCISGVDVHLPISAGCLEWRGFFAGYRECPDGFWCLRGHDAEQGGTGCPPLLAPGAASATILLRAFAWLSPFLYPSHFLFHLFRSLSMSPAPWSSCRCPSRPLHLSSALCFVSVPDAA